MDTRISLNGINNNSFTMFPGVKHLSTYREIRENIVQKLNVMRISPI